MIVIMGSWPAVAAAAVILLAHWGAAEGLDATGRSAEKHQPLDMIIKRSPDSNRALNDVLGADLDYGRGRPDKAVLLDCVEARESRCPASQAAIMASDKIRSVERSQSMEDLTGEVGRLVKRGRPRLNIKRPSYAIQSSSSTPLPSSSEELTAKQGRGGLRKYPELFQAAMRTSLGSIRPHGAEVSVIRAPHREGGFQVSIRNGHERWDVPFEESSRPAALKRVPFSKTVEGQRKYNAERRAKETPEDRQKRLEYEKQYRIAKKAKDIKTGVYQANYVYQSLQRKARLIKGEAIPEGPADQPLGVHRPFTVHWGHSKTRSAVEARTRASPGRGLPYDLNLRPDEQSDFASPAPRAWDDDEEGVLVRRTAPSGSNRGSASRTSSSLIRERTPLSSHQSFAQATGLASSSRPMRKYTGPKSKYAHFDALAKEMSANGQRVDWSAERTKEGAREGEIRIPIVGGESRVVHTAGPSESTGPSTEMNNYQRIIQRHTENGTLDKFRQRSRKHQSRYYRTKSKETTEEKTRATLVRYSRTQILERTNPEKALQRRARRSLAASKWWKEKPQSYKDMVRERNRIKRIERKMRIEDSKGLVEGEQAGVEGHGSAARERRGGNKESQQWEMLDLNQPASPEAIPSSSRIDLNNPPSQESSARQSGEDTAQFTLFKRMEIKESNWLAKGEQAGAEGQGVAGTKRKGGSKEPLQRRMLDLNQPVSPEAAPSRPWIDLNHPPSQKVSVRQGGEAARTLRSPRSYTNPDTHSRRRRRWKRIRVGQPVTRKQRPDRWGNTPTCPPSFP